MDTDIFTNNKNSIYLNRKRVLVTGGTGFIVSDFSTHLAEDNEVVVVDDGYRGTTEDLDTAELIGIIKGVCLSSASCSQISCSL